MAFFALGASYLWRSGLAPRDDEPKGKLDRSIRIVGAILITAMLLFYAGYKLGLYDPSFT